MQDVALAWLVYELTGSEALLGITSAMGSLPTAILAPFSGAIADRLEKRRILIFVQIAAGSIAMLLWLLIVTRWIMVWHILLLALGLGIVRAFDVPTRQSFWVELVGKEDLMSAITLNTAVVNLSRIFGPSAAGLVIARFGTATCFLLNAISFLPPLFALMGIPPSPVVVGKGESIWKGLGEVIRYLRSDKATLRILSLIGAWSLFCGQFGVLLPVLADRRFGVREEGFGFLVSSIGIGAIIGAVTAASLEVLGRRGKMVMAGSTIATIGLAGLAAIRSFHLALLTLSVIGFGMVMQNTTSNTLVQTLVPDPLRGRVMGIYSLAFIGLAPLGSIFYGFLGQMLGVTNALALGATCFGLVASSLFLTGLNILRLR